jgi:hypothetical protein
MDMRRFGRAYPELPEKIPPSNPERRELLEAPRKWMRIFDETMSDYFSGELTADHSWFAGNIVDYYNWGYRNLDVLTKGARALDDPTSRNDIGSELTFHRLNTPMVFLWEHLLYHVIPRDATELSDIQVQLALESAPFSRRLKQLSSIGEPSETKEGKLIMGQLNEFDAAIILIELMKTNPNLIVVPAPERFESQRQRSNLNSDFIFVDKQERHARGVQVKTFMADSTGVEHYNHDYVTLIDGSVDLGNSQARTRGRRDITTSLGGQIALGILSEAPLNKVPPFILRPEYMRNRAMGRELFRGRKSFLETATRHVGERVLHDLYQNPVPKQKTA